MDARIREDAAYFDALLNTVPFHYLLPAGADHDALQAKARDPKTLVDPKQVQSTSQRLREWLKTQQSGKRKKGKGGGGTREELQAKLHSRIDELREKRRVEQSARDKAQAEARKNLEGDKGPKKAGSAGKGEKKSPRIMAKDLEFSNVGGATRKADLSVAELAPNAPGTKKRKLQQQLAEAEQQRAKLQKLGGEDRDRTKHSMAMQKALQRAAGEKVHDNTTKLRKALKGIEQKKVKSAKAWNERKDTAKKEKEEKQERSAANLKTKRQRGKKDFKEKKGRAGFEGKRKGYLNSI